MTKRFFAVLLTFVFVFAAITPAYADDTYDFTLSLSGGAEYENGDYLTITGVVTKNGNAYTGTPVSIRIDAKSYDARMYSDRTDANAQGQYTFGNIKINEEFSAGEYVISVNAVGMIKTKEFKVVLGPGEEEATAEISPIDATFDKKASEQKDIEVTMTLDNTELARIKNGTEVLDEGEDYTRSANKVTIKKSYLAGLSIGQHELTFKFTNDAEDRTLTITVIDTTPVNVVNTINPTSATFDKKTTAQADIEVTVNGQLSAVKNGASVLTKGTDYTVNGDRIKLKKQYLSGLALGSTVLTFDFAAGNDCTLTVTVVDTTPERDHDNGNGNKSGGSSSTQPVTPASTPAAPGTVQVPAPTLDAATGAARTAVSASAVNSALASASVNANGLKEIGIPIPKVQGAKSYMLGLPSGILASADGAATAVIQMQTDLGTVAIPNNMLTPALAAQGGNVGISLGLADTSGLPADLQAQIGGRPVYDLNFEVNGVKTDWNNPNAPVTVSVNYTPTAEELSNPDGIVVWYLDPVTNIPAAIPNCKYDPATGKVTFTVTHFSKYAIAFVKNAFNDIKDYAWASKQINSMAAKEILRPVSKAAFNPKANITRADFMYGLVRALGLIAKVDGNFSDINPKDYYYSEIGIAKKLGITTGIGGDKFDPDAAITRQDMMTQTVRALEIAKKLKAGNSVDLSKFADNGKIAAYARKGVAAAVGEGIIIGDGKNINPTGYTTRAEAAVILHRIFNK